MQRNSSCVSQKISETRLTKTSKSLKIEIKDKRNRQIKSITFWRESENGMYILKLAFLQLLVYELADYCSLCVCVNARKHRR